jgi:hypothetical protein
MATLNEMNELYNGMTEEEMESSDPKCIEKRMKLVQLEHEEKKSEIIECEYCKKKINKKNLKSHQKTDECKAFQTLDKNGDTQCECCFTMIKPRSLRQHQKSKKCLLFQKKMELAKET